MPGVAPLKLDHGYESPVHLGQERLCIWLSCDQIRRAHYLRNHKVPHIELAIGVHYVPFTLK